MGYNLTCGHCGKMFLNTVTHYCKDIDVIKQSKFFIDFLPNPKIKEIIICGSATIILFHNGKKSVTKCRVGDAWRCDLGILFAWTKYAKKQMLKMVLTKQHQVMKKTKDSLYKYKKRNINCQKNI